SNGSSRPRSAAVRGMNWAMPCARSPLLVRGPTTSAWKRLSCQITRAKNSSGRFCARAADSIMRQRDSRTSTFPVRAGAGGGASADADGGDSADAEGGASVAADGGADGVSVRSLSPWGGGLGGGAFFDESVCAGGGAGAAGAVVSDCCARAGAAANSISAIIAMRAMRDNGETVLIGARQHTSARQGGEVRRGSAGRSNQRTNGSCVPSPVYGGGTGRGHAKR